jgi:hypothetical protein
MTAGISLRQCLAIAYTGLSVAAAVTLAYLAYVISCALVSGTLFQATQLVTPWMIVLTAAVYIAGHIFRSMRLALLIGGWNVGLRLIMTFHFLAAGVSLAMPLKLGEFYRIAALSRLIGSITRAVEIVWWERLLDVIALIIIMIIALRNVSGENWQQFSGVIALSFGFIAISILVFFVLPDNIRRASVLIIRRYKSRHTVPVLRVLDRVRRSILEAPRMVRGKTGSLAALTVLIWACEICTFAVVLLALGQTITSAPDALLRLLSVLTQGQTLVGMLNAGVKSINSNLLPYFAATQAPLAFLGLFAGVSYALQRMRR